MKKLFIASVLAGFILTSCQKANQEELFTPEQTVTTAQPEVNSTGWQTITLAASAVGAKGLTVSQGNIATQSVNDEVLANGLVLVYSKADSGVELLPASAGATEWTYSVSKGRVNVSATSKDAIASATVMTVVVPAGKVAALENAGHTRNELVNLPYESAKSLFGL